MSELSDLGSYQLDKLDIQHIEPLEAWVKIDKVQRSEHSIHLSINMRLERESFLPMLGDPL